MTDLASSLLVLLLLFVAADASSYSRFDFPADFTFGSGTTAYQVEGATKEDGRTPSIWDTFVQSGGEDGESDIGCDQYHKYKEDVKLMADMGLDAYRFSISWSRLIPNGRGPLNPKGLEYYNNLINELLIHGIQPHVTLNNYDLPQVLEDEYGGWVSPKIVEDFTSYAESCFREFGDRVLHWTTVNEPNIAVLGGYDLGILPPQRCSAPFGTRNCSKGNSTTEPYLAMHHSLLAHASAANLYRANYKDKQHGHIGITVYGFSFTPLTKLEQDANVVHKSKQFLYNWVLHPLVFGDYSNMIKERAGPRLPIFTEKEYNQVKGSYDFIGIIYYADKNIKYVPNNWSIQNRDVFADIEATFDTERTLEKSSTSAKSLRGVLEYLKQDFGNPPTILYENGFSMKRNLSLEDVPRVEYMQDHIGAVLDALRNGSNIQGYFTWSFLDIFELLDGYKSCYGLIYVDLDDPHRKRYPKLSARWFTNFLRGKSTSLDEVM